MRYERTSNSEIVISSSLGQEIVAKLPGRRFLSWGCILFMAVLFSMPLVGLALGRSMEIPVIMVFLGFYFLLVYVAILKWHPSPDIGRETTIDAAGGTIYDKKFKRGKTISQVAIPLADLYRIRLDARIESDATGKDKSYGWALYFFFGSIRGAHRAALKGIIISVGEEDILKRVQLFMLNLLKDLKAVISRKNDHVEFELCLNPWRFVEGNEPIHTRYNDMNYMCSLFFIVLFGLFGILSLGGIFYYAVFGPVEYINGFLLGFGIVGTVVAVIGMVIRQKEMFHRFVDV